jgi:hypothetical protein
MRSRNTGEKSLPSSSRPLRLLLNCDRLIGLRVLLPERMRASCRSVLSMIMANATMIAYAMM